jgi:hypothetical protein
MQHRSIRRNWFSTRSLLLLIQIKALTQIKLLIMDTPPIFIIIFKYSQDWKDPEAFALMNKFIWNLCVRSVVDSVPTVSVDVSLAQPISLLKL